MTPGPTPVPPEILLAMAKPIIHHRTPEFQSIFKEINENLKYLFQTTNDVFTLTCSGTGAMETAVVNLMFGGDTAICVQGGKFGERWTELCQAHGINVITIDVEWGNAVSAEVIKKELGRHKDAKAVFTTHCETSTGSVTDIASIGAAMKDEKAVLVVDAISSLGAINLETDNWAVDVVISGSQKGLMIPPGLGFCSVSKKAWKLVEQAKCPRYYFDLRRAKKALAQMDTAFTPAITLCMGLNEALKMLKKDTMPKVLERHSRLARVVRAAMLALGLKLYASKPADALTAVCVPEGIDGEKLVNMMREEYSVIIAGGQAQLKGKIFRIAHLGYMNEFDIITEISCIELTLKKLGYEFECGKGVGAAEKELLNQLL